MTTDDRLLEESAEDLFENAPCGYLSTLLDGTLVKVNRTFETWTGYEREGLLGVRRLPDLLSAGGRIYYETHVAPLLVMQGFAREIAVDIVRADGTRLPALINATLRSDGSGSGIVRTTVFDATDRRRYERELVNARRQEQEIAKRLQLSLLACSPPTADGLQIEVAYRAGVRGTEVGGDWYDAFWLREGESIGLVVGDVVGRGIDAAATMGQVRSALRALASTGLRPGPLFDALDGFARAHHVGRMTTLAHAQLDLATRRLHYACAGHPPPIVVAPGSEPHAVWEGRSLPLDAWRADDAPRAEGVLELEPGSTLLLYTDGLVERRDKSIDAGIARLVACIAEQRAEEPATLAEAIIHALRDPVTSDDVCLLVTRLS